MKLLCVPAFAICLFAQTPAFEVASIKPNRTDQANSSIRRGAGQTTMSGVSLRKVTLVAYGIPDDREYALSGPDWMGTDRYDILAKYPAGTTQEQFRAMLQNLLAERFHLALHNETRQLPAYALVVAKSGPRLKPAAGFAGGTNGRPGFLDAKSTTIRKLADLLARMTGQPVADETGLAGAYDFQLEWSPDETIKLAPDAPPVTTNPNGPSLFSALQEQLGLKLEARKGPVEVLVVDRIERTPTEN
jgi:uncharacterized protein (TIGR03435 family)